MYQEREKCLLFVILSESQLSAVPIIITDQFNKNVWKSLNSGTVYTKPF